MLQKETFVPLQYLKKEAYTGSMKGMRYRVKKEGENLEACVYPQPYCYEATPEEEKHKASFPFSEEGRIQAVEWILEQYYGEEENWNRKGRK